MNNRRLVNRYVLRAKKVLKSELDNLQKISFFLNENTKQIYYGVKVSNDFRERKEKKEKKLFSF
jgi:hypothetical protein